MKTIVVVGAGIGGLVTAGLLANRGFKVTLLERSPILGGRSHVLSKDGFTLPYGAHAVLSPKAEPMKSIFKELNIRLNFNKPSISKFKMFSKGKVLPSPLSLGALTSPVMDGFIQNFVFVWKFLQMVKSKPDFDKSMTVQEWIDQNVKDASVARVIRAYAALTVYDGALDRYPMNAFVELTNFEFSTNQPLGYAGYNRLLEQLEQSILTQGGEIHLGQEVKSLVIQDGKATGVVTKDRSVSADSVVLNLPPQAIGKMSEYQPLQQELAPLLTQPPQYVYVHDVMLSRQIRNDITNILDLDESVYLNVYNLNIPDSAPPGTQLLTLLRFLSAEEQADDTHVDRSRKSVERILDAAYTGWRDCLTGTRIVKRAAVNGIARRTGSSFLPFQSHSVSSLYYVGDSTSGRGGLGLPAYDSARTVADLIAQTLLISPVINE